MTTQPAPSPKSIDADPEMFHGLTIFGSNFGAQIRTVAVPGPDWPEDMTIIGEVETLVIGGLPPETKKELDRRGEFSINAAGARKLRDLLNIATARGHLD